MIHIATIHTDFPSKFGIPRQSGLVPELQGEIIFEPEYRRPEALLGIEDFSHLWLLWEFSEAVKCQTAHCGRRKPHVDFGTSASPTAQSRG